MYQTLNETSNETLIGFNMYLINNNNLSIYKAIRGIVFYFLTFWTIIGNIFILIAISTNKKLKKNGTSNILIGNLAFSDLLLGLTVLPFSATADTFKKWFFGEIICEIWLSLDVLCCTASIWGLLMIAIDRYIATIHPIKYRQLKTNPKIAIIYISTSWFISLLISLGPLFLYDNAEKAKKQSSLKQIEGTNDHVCFLFNELSFVILSSIGSFYFPLFLMIILYSKVIQKIHNLKKFRQQNKNQRDLLNEENNKRVSKSAKVVTVDDKKREARTSKILIIIMASFVACWLPFFLVGIIFIFDLTFFYLLFFFV
jgi:hypothetical protein